MKTLDEVIWAVENCDSAIDDCAHCSYCKDDCEDLRSLRADAIHYLKEYRDTDENYKKAIAHVIEVIDHYEKMVADYLADNNPPLTWDELKQMEGKPVWVEALLYKQWAVIAYVGSDHIRFEGANLYAPESRVYMGEANGWQAYRKERE